ncbi:hypothetical protein BC739_003919 [Kutzneria viridogrisea]|uniref:Uncharacterized protein n=1 Tax=Kutzneria viridogrisea TaxID=47990 RepID=A0ABR6BIK7_9PSEU|nr:hypothetical protein [Kutzneria viridogrisea]
MEPFDHELLLGHLGEHLAGQHVGEHQGQFVTGEWIRVCPVDLQRAERDLPHRRGEREDRDQRLADRGGAEHRPPRVVRLVGEVRDQHGLTVVHGRQGWSLAEGDLEFDHLLDGVGVG